MFWNNRDNSQAKPLLSSYPNGFIFGKYHRKYICKPANLDGNILVVGETCNAFGIAVSTLKSWKERVFAIDINGELIEKVVNVRGIDNIKIFNPSNTTTCRYDPFYPLEHSNDHEAEARKIAMDICPLLPKDEEFYIKAAQKLLMALILFYHGFGFDFSSTMLQIHSKPIRQQIDTIMDTGLQSAKAHVEPFIGTHNLVLSTVFSKLIERTSIFVTPELQRATSRTGSFITPADLECGKDIFCCISDNKIDQWQPLLALIIRQSLDYVDQRQGRNYPSILFLLDNFHRLGRINRIALKVAAMRGKKVTIALFVQRTTQIEELYGELNTSAMVDCCSYQIEMTRDNNLLISPFGTFEINCMD